MDGGDDSKAAGRGIWSFEGDIGYRRAIEGAGSVAAPLLAGFSFTLFVLLLPSLSPDKTVVTVRGARLVTESEGFSAAPEVAAGLVLLAGLLFVFSVQAAMFLRMRNHRPADLMELYPHYFPQGDSELKVAEKLPGWNDGKWLARNVGDRWFAGWTRKYLYTETRSANRWADWMRRLYQSGILALLVGLTVLVWPPEGAGDTGRWAMVGIGIVGTLGEVTWMTYTFVRDLAGRVRAR